MIGTALANNVARLFNMNQQPSESAKATQASTGGGFDSVKFSKTQDKRRDKARKMLAQTRTTEQVFAQALKPQPPKQA